MRLHFFTTAIALSSLAAITDAVKMFGFGGKKKPSVSPIQLKYEECSKKLDEMELDLSRAHNYFEEKGIRWDPYSTSMDFEKDDFPIR